MNIPTKFGANWPRMYYGKPLSVHTPDDNSSLPRPNFMKFASLRIDRSLVPFYFANIHFCCCRVMRFVRHRKKTPFLHMSDNKFALMQFCTDKGWWKYKTFGFSRFSLWPNVINKFGVLSLVNFHILIFSETTEPMGTKLNRNVHWMVTYNYDFLVHLAKWFQRRFLEIKNKICLWQPCLLTDRNKMSNLYSGPSVDAYYQVSVHLAKWLKFQRRFFRYWPIRKKNCLWQPCLLTYRDEISNLYRGPTIFASYQVSVHLAKWCQRRRFLKIDQSETEFPVVAMFVNESERNEQSILRIDLPYNIVFLPSFSSFG